MPITEIDLQAAAEFLEWDLRDTANIMHERAERSDAAGDRDWASAHTEAEKRLDELADAVKELSPDLLAEYASARHTERHQLRGDGGDTIHCSMTREIGFLLEPKTIDDVVRTYVSAVNLVRADPRWRDPDADMYEFWVEFSGAGHA